MAGNRPMDHIICPYCFKQFSHEDVHFRIKTVYDPDQFDDPAPGGERLYSIADVRTAAMPESERKRRVAVFSHRSAMTERDDERYLKFWDPLGGTTEDDLVSVGMGEYSRKVQSYQLPVFDPNDGEDAQFFAANPIRRNVNGFVFGATDCEGVETTFRVCPFCHNPLPGSYGYYPVKFISVIGITGAGKTVYLSQLCKYIADQFAQFGVAVNPTSSYAYKYMSRNPVMMGKPLPAGTAPETLLQPLCFDITYTAPLGGKMTQTLVFYDIAGENCMIHEDGMLGAGAMKFGPFIVHSDGIMLVIPPEQITKGSAAAPKDVLTVIHTLFGSSERGVEALEHIPMAVCISKGDMVDRTILGAPMSDLQSVVDPVTRRSLPVFNAMDYNELFGAINAFVEAHVSTLSTSLRSEYPCSDYFMFSAIGTDVVKGGDPQTGVAFDTPAAPASPRRLAEPLLWMLTKFEYIGSNGFIDEINDWFCPRCSRRMHRTMRICPDCRLDISGTWRCPSCDKVYPDSVEWCTNRVNGWKCNVNRFGERKHKLFGLG